MRRFASGCRSLFGWNLAALLAPLLAWSGCGDDARLGPSKVVPDAAGPDTAEPDTGAPGTVIDRAPAALSSVSRVVVEFHATGAATGFTCTLDRAAPQPCSSPWAFDATDGAHELAIAAAGGDGRPGAPATASFAIDTVAPVITITGGPTGTTLDSSPTFTFSIAGELTAARCRVDTAAFAACTTAFTSPELAGGPHVFEIEADDAAGNTGRASRSFRVDPAGGVCGDGVINGSEICDGADLDGASCESLGHAPGALACAATCDGFVATACDGGFVAAGTGFTGRVCFDGIKFGRAPGVYVAACSEDTGVWKAPLAAGNTTVAWASANGSTAGQMVANPHGRALIAPPDNPSVVFLSDSSTAVNGVRSNNFESAVQPPAATSWSNQVAFASGGVPLELFAARIGSSNNNIVAGWHPALGAVVAHGNFNATATVSAVGPAVTGTVTAVASGAFNLPSTDIHIAVWGKTPAGADATGGGIYWSCDQIGPAGGTYVAHDTGIAASDKPLVWSLTADPASFISTTRLCPATQQMVGGYAATYYAALRGGGQIYKTIDGGESWTRSNTGLPVGAEVYSIAIDCSRLAAGFPALCVNHELVFAATSAGLYQSRDAGAHWTLAGLEGKPVRGVAVSPEHPEATAPRVFVGVDDAVGIYERNLP